MIEVSEFRQERFDSFLHHEKTICGLKSEIRPAFTVDRDVSTTSIWLVQKTHLRFWFVKPAWHSMRWGSKQFVGLMLACWQLVLPSSAPWLHSLMGDFCCTGEVANASPPHSHSHGTCHHHAQKPPEKGDEGSSERLPVTTHDCSECALCQAISAPRILTGPIDLPTLSETASFVVVAICADPQLGFGLPLQARAPPLA